MKIHPKPDNICSYFETARFFPGQVDASLREPHKGGDTTVCFGGGVAPAFLAAADIIPEGYIVPELSEWDAVHFG